MGNTFQVLGVNENWEGEVKQVCLYLL